MYWCSECAPAAAEQLRVENEILTTKLSRAEERIRTLETQNSALRRANENFAKQRGES